MHQRKPAVDKHATLSHADLATVTGGAPSEGSKLDTHEQTDIELTFGKITHTSIVTK